MGSFKISGGNKLKGELIPQGAKNEALQILSAVLLTADEVIINKIPDIVDVNKLIDLLRDLGVKVNKLKKDGSWSFKADDLDLNFMHINNAIQVEFSFNPNDFLDKRLEIFKSTIDFFSIVKKQNIAQISENKKVLRPSPIGRIPKKIYYLRKEKISFQRRNFE